MEPTPQTASQDAEKTIFRVQKRVSHFTQISNETLRDKTLSFKARGVLAMLLSNVDTWEVHIGWIQEQGTEGREAVQGAMKELERAGYLTHSERPRIGGKFMGNVWTIHEEAVGVTERTNRTKWATEDAAFYDRKRLPVDGEPGAGNHERETVNGSPSDGFPTTKKNNGTEHQAKEEHQTTPKPPEASTGAPPRGGDFFADQPTDTLPPDYLRVGALLNRRATTAWSPREIKALQALKIMPDDLELVEKYYSAKDIPAGKDYRRRDLLTLLNNWPGEVDRARAYNPTPTPKNAPPRFASKIGK